MEQVATPKPQVEPKLILAEAKGKYKEKARLLKWLSLTLSNLADSDDGNALIKIRLLNIMADKVFPKPDLSMWERSVILKDIVEIIDLIFTIGDAKDEATAIKIIKSSNLPDEILDELQGLIS